MVPTVTVRSTSRWVPRTVPPARRGSSRSSSGLRGRRHAAVARALAGTTQQERGGQGRVPVALLHLCVCRRRLLCGLR